MNYINPVRKIVKRGDRSVYSGTDETLVLTKSVYRTNGEELILVKNVEHATIILDSITTEKITIKVITSCTINPDINKIDEDWDEINLFKGACVSFQFVYDTWYILASDGLKLE